MVVLVLMVYTLLGGRSGAWHAVGNGFRLSIDHMVLLRLVNIVVDAKAGLHRSRRHGGRFRHVHDGRRIEEQVKVLGEDIVKARGDVVVEVVQVLVQALLRRGNKVGRGHGEGRVEVVEERYKLTRKTKVVCW